MLNKNIYINYNNDFNISNIIIFLIIRKRNCSYKPKENFNNLNLQTDMINNEYFNKLKIEIEKNNLLEIYYFKILSFNIINDNICLIIYNINFYDI